MLVFTLLIEPREAHFPSLIHMLKPHDKFWENKLKVADKKGITSSKCMF